MHPIYQSGAMKVSAETHETGVDGKGRSVVIDRIDKVLQGGQLYIFWIEVLSGIFSFGFSRASSGVKALRAEYPLLRDLQISKWANKESYTYVLKDKWFKLFAVEFC